MIPRDFDAITKADIDALVTNAVAEGRAIEYKQQIPGNGDEDKKEFLADVSSFANAGGGDIIFGVVEKRDGDNKPTNLPEKAEGLTGINAGAEINRLDAIIQSGIEPRIPGCRIRNIDGFTSGPVLVIRIPKSWAGPHMVTYKNLSRFFSRTSAGKHQLDVREIRSAFNASGDQHSKIAAFRTDQLGKIIANEGPVQLPELPKVILHLVPLSVLDSTSQVDLSPLQGDHAKIPPLHGSGCSVRHNLDGLLTYTQYRNDQPAQAYLQVFRSGIFETVATGLLIQREGMLQLPAGGMEQKILAGIAKYLAAMKKIGVPLPVVVMLTLHGVKGYRLVFPSVWYDYNELQPIDRETLLLPDVLLEDYSTRIDGLMRPIFDALWQSAGFPACKNYTGDGHWSAATA